MLSETIYNNHKDIFEEMNEDNYSLSNEESENYEENEDIFEDNDFKKIIHLIKPLNINYNEIYFKENLDEGKSFGYNKEDLSEKENEKEKNNNNEAHFTFFHGMKLTKGEKYWEVKELEVYKIIYL